MPLNASLLPYNFVLRAFRQKMGGVPLAPPIFYDSLPRDEAVLPKHMPNIDSTLESLVTLHCLEGANIRSQTE